MSAADIITAYSVAVPDKQKQNLPGLDKHITPGVEYSKLEAWSDEGKPSLYEYAGSGKLTGKTAIITGGDSGIGRATAIMFAREGCKGITVSYLPQEAEDANAAKATLEKEGTTVVLMAGDLMQEDFCKAVVDTHIQKFGKLNILVNNASKQIINKNFEEIDLKKVESTFRSNILQMFATTKFALPHLNRGSSIINTTSVTAYRGSGGLVDYSSTKGAIVSFTRSLAVKLAPRGIRVNAIAPGPVITALQPASRSAEDMEGMGVGMPLHGRAGQPAELGPAYVFLASSDSNIMTGQVLHLNSGDHIGSS
ncbi:NAD(P)-binding protein [Collybia nuda]|uniref:NAD(P)-binding protein n=1 Tax=Collybia nuda TaxID=64659 RepID=A0A9P6CNH9_9AGAR|nr:NAD(P)-binding protein [Collybia nuda]